jgi:hypothetical protein
VRTFVIEADAQPVVGTLPLVFQRYVVVHSEPLVIVGVTDPAEFTRIALEVALQLQITNPLVPTTYVGGVGSAGSQFRVKVAPTGVGAVRV